MQLNLVYFASVREQMKLGNEQIKTTDNITNVQDLQQWLAQNNSAFAAMQESTTQMLVAVNQTSANANTLLSDGDEVAFFPPVTGG